MCIRDRFTREAMLNSDWYQERLKSQQNKDIQVWEDNVSYLNSFLAKETHAAVSERLDIKTRLTEAKEQLAKVKAEQYLDELVGTLGRQPIEN